MTTVYFVRHGETTANASRIFQGISDFPLSPKGIAQGKLLQKRFAQVPYDHIFSSPLSRAVDTAKILNRPAKDMIDSHSGLAGIAHWINSYYRLEPERQLDKGSPLVAEVKKWVDAEYEAGRVTVITDEELKKVIADACERLQMPPVG